MFMATALSKVVIAQRILERRDRCVANLGDKELLDRFLRGQADESNEAFEVLVLRYGPMVMGVCLHVLQRAEDAEDAFQATLLALARKAETIRNHRVLAAWLHEVAYRNSIRVRAKRARRQDREQQSAALCSTTITPDHEHVLSMIEVRPVLHEEVSKLPDKYRLPIVLSYIEGKSNEEVAARLGWPVGTVKGRLSRARDLLRSRLSRRGVVLSAVFISAALSARDGLSASLSASLLEKTLREGVRAGLEGAAESGLEQHEASSTSSLIDSSRVIKDPKLGGKAVRRAAMARTGLYVLIAILSIAFAISSYILSDPSLSRRITSGSGAKSMTHRWFNRDCR
jgi:RNA polymerase sigma factor (sigma-70 family)